MSEATTRSPLGRDTATLRDRLCHVLLGKVFYTDFLQPIDQEMIRNNLLYYAIRKHAGFKFRKGSPGSDICWNEESPSNQRSDEYEDKAISADQRHSLSRPSRVGHFGGRRGSQYRHQYTSNGNTDEPDLPSMVSVGIGKGLSGLRLQEPGEEIFVGRSDLETRLITARVSEVGLRMSVSHQQGDWQYGTIEGRSA